MISDRASNGYTSAGSLKAGIYREGTAYCAKQKKGFQPIGENTVDGRPNSWTWASAEIKFRCLDKNDPELSRPNLVREADIKIENSTREKIEIKNQPTTDLYTELTKLKGLLDSGIITQEEFETRKKVVLSKY